MKVGYRGMIAKARLPKAHLFHCCGSILLACQTNPKRPTPPCLNQTCVAGHIGGQTSGRGIHVLGQSKTSGAPHANWPNYMLWAKWLHNPCRLGGPQSGDKIRSGYITLAVLGAHGKKGLHNPCCLRGRVPKAGTKSVVATKPLPSWGPMRYEIRSGYAMSWGPTCG